MSRLAELTATWRQSLRSVQTTKLVILPSLTGILTGAATIGFVELVNLVQWLILGSADLPMHVLPHLHWYHILLAPVIGGLILGPLVHFLAPEAEGHGVPEVIEAVMLRGGRIRRRVAFVKSLASAVTIGSGGSVGREGPVVQIGAAVGSAVGQSLRLPAEHTKTLVACGGGAGIAAVFNAPIAGSFFALEVITGNFAMPAFGPVILACVLSTVVSRAYFGDYPAFRVQPYEMQSLFEIVAYGGLGLFCGLVAVGYITAMEKLEAWVPRVPIPKIWQPAAGGLVLGALFNVLPNLYGVGYGTMDGALRGSMSWQLLAVLVFFKIFATSFTLAAGGSGGVFLPSLYIGSVAGGLYGVGVHALLPRLTAGSGAYALVGMAGVLAAATHSPITAMLLLFEVTGDYKIILPVMIVVTFATMLGRALKHDSLYSLKLSRQGLALHRREDVIMRTHTVGEIMQPASHVLADTTPIAAMVQYFLDHEAARVYVADSRQHLVGGVSIHDIQDPEVRDLGPLVLARDMAEPNLHAVGPTDTLADCMEHFILSEHDELPVVNPDGELIGVVSRRDVLRVYSSELLRHEFLGLTTQDDSTQQSIREYVRFTRGLTIARTRTPPQLVGRSLREANLRALFNLTVVAVRHAANGEDELPDPEQPLTAADELVIVGKAPDIEHFQAGRAAGAG